MALRSQPLAMGLKQITGLGDAVNSTDAVNKGQLDAAIAGAVPDGSVTNAKLANMAANTIKANLSDSSATPADVSLSALLDDAVSNAQGSLLYRGASGWTQLAPGTSGDFLKTQGATANPVWATVTIPPPEWTTIKKTADQTITSSAAFTDDTHLKFSAAANTTYAIRAAYFVTAQGGGYNFAINGPSATRIRIISQANGGVTAVTAYNSTIMNVGGSAIVVFYFHGSITTSASGTIAFRISQQTSNASGTIFEKGSWLEYMQTA